MQPLASPKAVDRCPALETLVNFNFGRLTDAELEVVGAHVASCAECVSVLESLHDEAVSDPAVDRLKQVLERTAFHAEPGYAAMAAAARAIRHSASSQLTDEESNQAPSLVGMTLGSYIVQGKLGEGGMGVVYRARHLSLERPVALKMIRAGAHAAEDTFARFVTEAKAVARLQHTGVVQIYEVGQHEGLPYFAMELVEGESLSARLSRGPLAPREAAELVRTLAEAVAFAHEKQVLHRDLKPSNILLTTHGTPKIADFGLAKLLDVEGDGRTRSDAILGTPRYMAPEQADGRTKQVGPATDVHALGAILYEVLTGQPVFRGEDRAEILKRVSKAEPVPPSRLRGGIPVPLEAICLKCLEKTPARRYASARALADDLERWLLNKAPRGIPHWPERITRAVLRRKAALAVCLVVTVIAGTSYLLNPDRPLRQVQSDLVAGLPVTLIGEKRGPQWFRWKEGQTLTQTGLAKDNTWTVRTAGFCLIELLPDPQHENYRFAAKVRHEKSELTGEVGLYVMQQSSPGARADIRHFTQLAFNDVIGSKDFPQHLVHIPGKGIQGWPLPRPLNEVRLYPRLHSEEGVPGEIDCRMSGRSETFRPAGVGNGTWRDVQVTVRPTSVVATWEGKSFQLGQADIMGRVAAEMDWLRPRRVSDPFVQAFQPLYLPRGGLGLLLVRGTASFRDVTVTPLRDDT